MGFASVPGYGLQTTTGGGNATPIVVRTPQEFRDAVERLDIQNKKLRESTPRVVVVGADLDLGVLGGEKPGDFIKSVGLVRVGSNTTIYAPGAGFTLSRGVVEVHGASNVIIRNLKFRDLWEPDPTGAYDRLGWDYVRITNSGQVHSHHVWVDHCDFGKVYDGMLDITHGSDLVTVSWCHFAGDERGAQKKASLIGHSSSASAAAMDKGNLNVTFSHNWFEKLDDRAPRARFGNIHVLNDVVEGAKNGTISVSGAVTLVEDSVYRDCKIATSFSHDKDSVEKGHGGTICIVDSRNEAPKGAEANFEGEHNFKSNVERAQLHFNPVSGFEWKDLSQLPYQYQVTPVNQVESIVKAGAGVGKIGLQ
jgi:pectate lyase